MSFPCSYKSFRVFLWVSHVPYGFLMGFPSHSFLLAMTPPWLHPLFVSHATCTSGSSTEDSAARSARCGSPARPSRGTWRRLARSPGPGRNNRPPKISRKPDEFLVSICILYIMYNGIVHVYIYICILYVYLIYNDLHGITLVYGTDNFLSTGAESKNNF